MEYIRRIEAFLSRVEGQEPWQGLAINNMSSI